jgi:hypothetical protein
MQTITPEAVESIKPGSRVIIKPKGKGFRPRSNVGMVVSVHKTYAYVIRDGCRRETCHQIDDLTEFPTEKDWQI